MVRRALIHRRLSSTEEERGFPRQPSISRRSCDRRLSAVQCILGNGVIRRLQPLKGQVTGQVWGEAGLPASGGQEGATELKLGAHILRTPLTDTSAPSAPSSLGPKSMGVCGWVESPRLGGGHRDELRSLLTQSSWVLVSPLAAPLQVRRFFLR